MPVAHESPDEVPVKAPPELQIHKPEYKSSRTDTQYQPVGSILNHVSGQRWTVEFYKQVRGADEDLQSQNVNRPAHLQQYDLIHEFELRVQTPLSTQFNPESGSSPTVGSAICHPSVKANVGDMFTASIPDGREAVFTITSSYKNSIMKDATFLVEYTLTSYLDDNLQFDLRRKVIREYHYNKDFAYYNQNPVLLEDDYALVRKLEQRYSELSWQYFKSFFSNEFQTLILPDQNSGKVYDPFLTKAVSRIFNTSDAPDVQYMRILNVADDESFKAVSIWDALIDREKRKMQFAFESVGLVGARLFTRDPMMEGVYHSGVSHVVYPADAELYVDYQWKNRTKPIGETPIYKAPGRPGRLADMMGDGMLHGLPYGDSPLVSDYIQPDGGTGGSYVLSPAFYARAETGMSKLEACVWDYLLGREVNVKLLTAFCDAWHTWGGVERFYNTPILLILIRSVIRGI